MAFRPEETFDLMRCMYRNGLLDRLSAIQGEALGEVMDETGINLGEIMNRLDQASDKSVAAVDRALGYSGSMPRYLTNDRLMRLASGLIDVPWVRRLAVKNMKRALLKVMVPEGPGSPARR